MTVLIIRTLVWCTIFLLFLNFVVKYWRRWSQAPTDSSWDVVIEIIDQYYKDVVKAPAADPLVTVVVRDVLRRVRSILAWIQSVDRRTQAHVRQKTVGSFAVANIECVFLTLIDVMLCFQVKCCLFLLCSLRFILYREPGNFTEAIESRWNEMEPKFDEVEASRRLRVVFIRHGESMWNRFWNQGLSLATIGRIVIGVLWEACLIGDLDSVMIDSPLSTKGVAQAIELQTYVSPKNQDDASSWTEIYGSIDRPKTAYLSSNLRRAVSTIAIGLRKVTESERVVVNPILQETCRNPDGSPYSSFGITSFPSLFEKDALPWRIAEYYKNRVDWGDKVRNPLQNMGPIKGRLEGFVEDLVASNSATGTNVFIVCGHSLWFRKFFRYYLPLVVEANSDAAKAKTRKISNTGMIGFDLVQLPAEKAEEPFWAIDPASVKPLHGGFL